MNAPTKVFPLGLTLLIVLALLLSSALVTAPVSAADLLVVTSIADDGDGSLREAIGIISPGGKITFSPSLSGQTITLASPLLINKNLIIDGSDLGVPITISGNNTVRVFQIGLLGEVTLSSLKITNGYGWLGGGINNQGEVRLIDSTVSENLAGFKGGGIFTNGTLIVEGSTFSYNEAELGGGIRDEATQSQITITDSTFFGNHAAHGGAIDVWGEGPNKINTSIFYGNSAEASGGAIRIWSSLTVENSTLSGNSTDSIGGGFNVQDEGMLTLQHVTLNDNEGSSGGGIYVGNNATLKYINTIIAHSTNGDCVDHGSIHSESTHNLVTDGSCSVATNLSGDPKLGPLADNGGPTLTHALQHRSPALDSGSAEHCPDYDQRGIFRPQVAGCDIGAFEVETLVVTNASNDLTGSLREAIGIISPGGKITFSPSLSGQTITLSSTLVIDKNLTIDGSDLTVPVTISGNNVVRVFLVGPSVEHVTLDNLSIVHGNMVSGGGIYNQGELTIINSTLSGNTAQEDGGGIYNQGELTIINCTFVNNYAQEGGGGIFNSGDSYLLIEDSTLSNNSTEGDGGGIFNMGYLEVVKSTLNENVARIFNDEGYGGAIFNHELSLQLILVNSTLSGNEAGANGGGIHNSGNLFIGNSTLYGNIAFYGGGIVNWSDLWFVNTIIASSTGGDCVDNGTIHVESTQNLVQDGSCQVHDLSNISGDPMLGPLANNGGPTLTHALLPWSPAIDAVYEDYCLPTDQRGISRPLDGNGDDVLGCDIGAFEFNPAMDGMMFVYLPLILH